MKTSIGAMSSWHPGGKGIITLLFLILLFACFGLEKTENLVYSNPVYDQLQSQFGGLTGKELVRLEYDQVGTDEGSAGAAICSDGCSSFAHGAVFHTDTEFRRTLDKETAQAVIGWRWICRKDSPLMVKYINT